MLHFAYAIGSGIAICVVLFVAISATKRNDPEHWRFIRLITLPCAAAFLIILALRFAYSDSGASLDSLLNGILIGRRAAYWYATGAALPVFIFSSLRERQLRRRNGEGRVA